MVEHKKGNPMTRKEIIGEIKEHIACYMTVKDLKKLLERYPDDMPIVVPEMDFDKGKFALMCDHTQHVYVPESRFKGNLYGVKTFGIDDDECMEVLVLWPS